MKRDFIVETITKNFMEHFFLKAFADEENSSSDDKEETKTTEQSPTETKETPVINYEDLIAKARREEKEKQYKSIEKYKTQVSSLTEQHNSDLLKIAELEEKIKSFSGNGDENIKKLTKSIEKLEGEKKSLQEKIAEFEKIPPVDEEEISKKLREELEKEFEIRTYRLTKIAENKDELPFPELVVGNTKEEIDASLASVLERGREYKKKLGVLPNMRVPNTVTNPDSSKVQTKEYSVEYLAQLDVRSPEYAEVRKNLKLH